MSRNKQAIIWAVVAAIVSQLGIMLAQGSLPLPKEILPFVPLLTAAISALSPYLKLAAGAPKP